MNEKDKLLADFRAVVVLAEVEEFQRRYGFLKLPTIDKIATAFGVPATLIGDGGSFKSLVRSELLQGYYEYMDQIFNTGEVSHRGSGYHNPPRRGVQ